MDKGYFRKEKSSRTDGANKGSDSDDSRVGYPSKDKTKDSPGLPWIYLRPDSLQVLDRSMVVHEGPG